MFKKLLLAFIVLNILVIAVFAITLPGKDQHSFHMSNGRRIEKYHTCQWILVDPKDWLAFPYLALTGFNGVGCESIRTIQLWGISIVDKRGIRAPEEER